MTIEHEIKWCKWMILCLALIELGFLALFWLRGLL